MVARMKNGFLRTHRLRDYTKTHLKQPSANAKNPIARTQSTFQSFEIMLWITFISNLFVYSCNTDDKVKHNWTTFMILISNYRNVSMYALYLNSHQNDLSGNCCCCWCVMSTHKNVCFLDHKQIIKICCYERI